MRACALLTSLLLSTPVWSVTKTIGFSDIGIGTDVTVYFSNFCLGTGTSVYLATQPATADLVLGISDDASSADLVLVFSDIAIGADRSVHISDMPIGADTICLSNTGIGADVSLHLTHELHNADLVVAVTERSIDKQRFLAALYSIGLLDKEFVRAWRSAETRVARSRTSLTELRNGLDTGSLTRTGLNKLTDVEIRYLGALLDSLAAGSLRKAQMEILLLDALAP